MTAADLGAGAVAWESACRRSESRPQVAQRDGGADGATRTATRWIGDLHHARVCDPDLPAAARVEAERAYAIELHCRQRDAEAAAIFRHVALGETVTAETRSMQGEAVSWYLQMIDVLDGQARTASRFPFMCAAAMGGDREALLERYCTGTRTATDAACHELRMQPCFAQVWMIRRMIARGRCEDAQSRLATSLREQACARFLTEEQMTLSAYRPEPAPLYELQRAIRECRALSSPL